MVNSVNSINLRGKSLLLTVKSIKVLGGKLLLMVDSVNSINLRGNKLLLVVKSINLGLVDLVVEGIGKGSLLVVSKSSLQSMVLDLGSLDTVGILRSNSTIGISYKS